jgi:DNA-binding NarL/FixJ family response regulator
MVIPPARERGDPVRVLIVEDHAGLRLVLRTLLESDERLLVLDAVGSGAEACAHPLLDDVDVALVDVGLPDVDGIQAMGHLRERHPGLRVVIMSGSGQDHTALEALAAGANGYLQKGALHDELIESLLGLPALARRP